MDEWSARRKASTSTQIHKNAHTTKILNIHPLSGIRTHGPGVHASEDILCLRPLGYRDQPSNHLGANDGQSMECQKLSSKSVLISCYTSIHAHKILSHLTAFLSTILNTGLTKDTYSQVCLISLRCP
jgi:hypothetical protein